MIIPVPAILHPLINAAAHVVKPERVWFETAGVDRLLRGGNVGAALAIGQAGLELIAPPELRLRSAACGVFPFGLAWKPIGSVCHGRKPGDELSGISPAHIRHRRLVVALCHELARLGGRALVPFAHGNRIAADGNRLERDPMNGLLGDIVVAAHQEGAAA